MTAFFVSMRNLDFKFYKDWIFINLFNIISVNWERKKDVKAVKGIFAPLKIYFTFTKDYAPFMFCVHRGKLFSIVSLDVQWKDKWNTPRHEENPFVSIGIFNKFFFNWEWKPSKDLGDDMDYWEQALWYLYYASYNKDKKGYDKLDINKARESWPWQDYDTKVSTWNNKFLIDGNSKGSN